MEKPVMEDEGIYEEFFLIKPLENPLESASTSHCGKSTLGKVKNFQLAKLFAGI
jgi:hypothetical protein